jgi:hypothetical protein
MDRSGHNMTGLSVGFQRLQSGGAELVLGLPLAVKVVRGLMSGHCV